MSETLAAAAAALGAPEDLVQRSADARATADGTSAEAVLAAWAGGAPMPTAPAPATDTPTDAPSESGETATAPSAAASVPTPAVAAAVAASAVDLSAVGTATAPTRNVTPVLTDQKSRPVASLLILAGLFALGLLVTVITPSYTGGDYNHLVPDATLSVQGEDGLDVYLNEGCWYCHTQLVRPVVADVGLGPATENFANSLDTPAFGIQRIGPDLAHVGARTSLLGGEGDVTDQEFVTLLTDPSTINPESLHPTYSFLSDGDIAALATYLVESK